MKGLRQRHGARTIRLRGHLERSQVAKEFMGRRARQDAPRWEGIGTALSRRRRSSRLYKRAAIKTT